MTENIEQPTARKPFTAITWEAIANKIFTGENYHWDALADLKHELAPRLPHLSREEIALLVDFTQCGLPVVLTWETRHGNGRIEVTTATVLISELHAPSVTSPSSIPGRIRVQYTGFEHGIYLPNVTRVEQTPKSITFRDAD